MSQSVSNRSTETGTRRVFIMAGHREDIVTQLKQLQTEASEASLIISPQPEQYPGLAVRQCRQAGELLGQEKSLVLFDCFSELCVDALAIVAGLVVGNGCLVLLMPERELWTSYYTSLFAQRFVRYIDELTEARILPANQENTTAVLSNYLMVESKTAPVVPTADQLSVIEKGRVLLLADKKSALVVISDRGRGKSSALGMLAAELLTEAGKIIITAPSFKATEQSFLHARRITGIKKFSQACLKMGNNRFQFLAPDELLATLPECDLLLIDEAASIPLPMLRQICEHYPRLVFATTVHGYEGTGRGFFIRFFRLLDTITGWEKIEMTQPVRWSDSDTLEPWLFRLLCLDAEIPEIEESITLDQVTVREVSALELSENEALLNNVFALLALAHYRTRPSDLKRLFDDDLNILLAEYQGVVVGVLLSIREGGFNELLSRQIYNGERRPQGNLLAQTLCYHCGVAAAAGLVSQRIMRIVVHPQIQGQGTGSKLISRLIQNLQQSHVDIVGASFGLTRELFSFWQQNGFKQVRIGFKKEQSSGEHAGVFIMPLTEAGRGVTQQCRERFISHWPYLKQTILREFDSALVDNKAVEINTMDYDRDDIESFVNTARSYELCIAGVNRWVLANQDIIEKLPKQYQQIIDLVVVKAMSWKQAAIQLELAGKKQTQELFKEAVKSGWIQANHQ